MASVPVVIQIDGLLTEEDVKRVTERISVHLKGALRLPDSRCWVLVHGQHDSGTIEGVFGPYTEEHADWLLGNMLNATYGNWTKTRLQDGPEAG